MWCGCEMYRKRLVFRHEHPDMSKPHLLQQICAEHRPTQFQRKILDPSFCFASMAGGQEQGPPHRFHMICVFYARAFFAKPEKFDQGIGTAIAQNTEICRQSLCLL